MTCIKTGARVFVENYGYVVAADIYEIDSAYIVRWNIHSRTWDKDAESTHHIIHWTGDAVWHREDIGVTVCPKMYLISNED